MARRTDDLERVPVDPLLKRYEYLYEYEENLHHAICTRMADAGFPAYMRPKKDSRLRGASRRLSPDTTHLKRRIGKSGARCGRTGNLTFSRTIPYEEAVVLARVLELDPHEAGV